MLNINALNKYDATLPEFTQIAWNDRDCITEHTATFSAAKQRLMNARIEFIQQEADKRANKLAVDSIILCPYGSFMLFILNYELSHIDDKFYMSCFTGNDRVSKDKARKPFTTFPVSSHSVFCAIQDLYYCQKEAKPFTHSLKVNDVMVSLWGSEQTNCTYYQVIKATKNNVTIRKIKKVSTEKDMIGTCSPLLGEFTGPEITKKVCFNNAVKIETYEVARPHTFTMIANQKIYDSNTYTTYA